MCKLKLMLHCYNILVSPKMVFKAETRAKWTSKLKDTLSCTVV